jgi:hypothetical protein
MTLEEAAYLAEIIGVVFVVVTPSCCGRNPVRRR